MRKYRAIPLVALCLVLLGAAAAFCAEDAGGEAESVEAVYEMQLSLGTGIEYNDNINDTSKNKTTDFIGHIKPSFYFSREGGRLKADIQYRGDYLFYLMDKDSEEYRHYLDASFTGELVENLFFLTVTESMKQVYDNVTRGDVIDDDYRDQVNRNRFTVSPRFAFKPTDRTDLSFGYMFTDTRYSKDYSGTNPKFLSLNSDQYDFNYNKNQDHSVFARVNHELSERAIVWTGVDVVRRIDNSRRSRRNIFENWDWMPEFYVDDGKDMSFYRYMVYVGGQYEFSEDLSARFRVGPSYNKPDEGDTSLRPFIEADVAYAVGRSVFGAAYNTIYEDDVYSGASIRQNQYRIFWNKEFDRARLTTSFSYSTYSEEIGNSSSRVNNFKPALNLTYDLTDRLSSFARYSAIIYEKRDEGADRQYFTYGLRYALGEESSLQLSHGIRHTEPYGQRGAYFVNRVMIELTHRF